MSILPDNFPTGDLPLVERYKVEAYYEQFVIKRYREYGMGHFWLACYAALPAVITPDLLYKMWLNFSKYSDGGEQQIHHVAVADLILSSLFTEVGTEIYEMPVEVKNAFLQYWKNELNDGNYYELPPIDEVAKFLLGYTKVYRTNNPQGDDAFREAQQITAWSYLNTKKAQELLMKSLAEANQTSTTSPDDPYAKAEQLRLLEFNRQTVERQDLGLLAKGQTKQQGMSALVGFSQQMRSLLEGDEQALIDFLEKTDNPFELADAPVGNLSIKAPEEVVKKMQVQTTDAPEEAKLFYLLVGIDEYQDAELRLGTCTEDVSSLERSLQLLALDKVEGLTLINEQATNDGVWRAFLSMLDAATNPNDQLLFFFAGHTILIDGEINLVLYDSSKQDNYRGLLLQGRLFDQVEKRKSSSPYVTFVLDADKAIEQLPNQKTAVVMGSGLETPDGSPFVNTFCKIFNQSKGRISLQKLVAATAHEMNRLNVGGSGHTTRSDGQDRMPKLFAYPETARHPLVRMDVEIREIQYLLRSSEYGFNGSANGVYDAKTDEALRSFLSEMRLEASSPEMVIASLEEHVREVRERQPYYFLFVFCNPQNRLPMVDRERDLLMEYAPRIEEASGAEVVILDSPSRAELHDYFKNPAYRHSLHLFHFAGYETDPEGDGQKIGLYLETQNEKALIDYNELHKWLDFQEELKLVFLNTCYSSRLAKLLTTRGVRAAIATKGQVMDEYAYTFSERFYNHMANGQSLIDAFDRSDVSPSGYGGGPTRAVNLTEEDEPTRFELFFNWAAEGEAKKWEWTKGVGKEEPIYQQSSYEEQTAPPPQLEYNNHLLVIAIDEYQNGFPAASSAVRQARSFCEILWEKYEFEKGKTTTLFNEQATKRNIIGEFDQYINKIGPEKNLVFLFIGEGELDEKSRNGYWYPYDAVPEERGSFISNTELGKYIGAAKAQQILIIVDSVFSDRLLQGGRATSNVALAVEGAYRWVLASGKNEAVSDGPPDEASPFMKAIINNLTKGDRKSLTAGELFEKIAREVSYNQKQAPLFGPLLGSGDEGGQFVFRQKDLFDDPFDNAATYSSLQELKADLKTKLAEDLASFFALTDQVVAPSGDVFNNVILLKSRYNSTKRDERMGVISREDNLVTLNQVRAACLDLLDNLSEGDLKEGVLSAY